MELLFTHCLLVANGWNTKPSSDGIPKANLASLLSELLSTFIWTFGAMMRTGALQEPLASTSEKSTVAGTDAESSVAISCPECEFTRGYIYI